MSIKTKNILKKIGLITLGIGAVGAVGMGGKALYDYAKNDLQTIHPTFEVGGLGDDGKYVNDELSLYTKDSFACEGLSAKLDFDSEISYQFFYYDINDKFISSSEIYTDGTSANIPYNAAYARVEITPLNDEDGKISLKERFSYPSQLNLKVDKNAESNVNNLFKKIGNCSFRIVNNPLNLVFEFGKEWHEDHFVDSDNGFSCTTTNLLKVDGNEYIKLDRKVFNDTEMNSELSVLQYTIDDNGYLKFLSLKLLNSDNSYSSRLDKNVKYLLFVYWSSNESLETFTPNIQNGISISKSIIE